MVGARRVGREDGAGTHQSTHLLDGELRRGGDRGEGDGAVGGGAEVLEERLGQAHQRDLLLEEGRVREERRLLGELRVVRLDERLVLVDVADREGAEEVREPREVGRLERGHHRVLEQLAEVVEPLAHERGDAQVERDRQRLLARHLLQRKVREQQEGVAVELVRLRRVCGGG